MKLRVNGNEHAFDGKNLQELIFDLKIDPNTVVVEHNGEIVARGTDRKLVEGDKLEIVWFVGGG